MTGSLHVGHALTYTLQDILIRFKRMCGFDAFWQPGTDHAGIATQMVVERQLAAQGITRQTLGREAFISKVWEWKQESGDLIVSQQKRLGISPDWNRQRFTLDEGLSKAVTKVFIDLYREGLIYRDKRLVNWDPKFQTAVSDLEVLSQDVKGHMWYIHYPLADDPTQFVTIATTRPETMLGDTAVAVHPEDERYSHLIGRILRLPLSDRVVPLIADEYCDMEKGSGAVKITPAHDFNDFEIGRRHKLPMINILDAHAHLNDQVPEKYQGISVEAARKLVLEDLEAQGLLEKVEPITHAVPFGERSGVQIQPWLTDQWFVDAKTLAQPALKAVEDGKTRFFPEHYSSTYFEWLRNIQPWCISRQIWWGHQIPVWYGPDGKVFVAESEDDAIAQARGHFGKDVSLTRDTDVLDTWFSSALWPFSTLGWPEVTPELKRYYPTDVLDTGHDIIFFWVARMMMMGLHFMKDVPFRTVYIHALVRDEKGAKMSKSKGNVTDPLDIMDKYGCDAVRFTLAVLAFPGRDLKLGESRIEGSRNFITKVWNAARFLQINQCAYSPSYKPQSCRQQVNRWIVSELTLLAQGVYKSLESYRFDEAASKIYQFLWGTFCDYYLEFLKPILSDEGDEKAQIEARETAAWVFTEVLKITHPIAPFVTEKLWDEFTEGKGKLLIASTWPDYGRETVNQEMIDQEACREMSWLVEFISEVRSYRAQFNVPPTVQLPVFIYEVTDEIETRVRQNQIILMRMARLSSIELEKGVPQSVKESIQFIVGETTVVIPLGGSIDVNAEIKRLKGELQKLENDIISCQQKLENSEFITKAKPEIIEEMQQRLETASSSKTKMVQALERLGV